jgi:triphosphatase
MLEIEYKFYSEVADSSRLEKQLSVFLGSQPEHHMCLDTYYDTQDQALFTLGYGLRVRQNEQSITQTLKSTAAPKSGSHSREEHHVLLNTAEPDLQAFPNPIGLQADSVSSVQNHLVPLFELKFQRSLWRWQQEDTVLEVALDVGERQVASRRLPIFELEVELMQGTPETAWPFVNALVGQWPLRLAMVNKAEWGYRMLWPLPAPEATAHTWFAAWLALDQTLDLGSIDAKTWAQQWQAWLAEAPQTLSPKAQHLWQQLQAQPCLKAKQSLAYGQLQWLLLQDDLSQAPS